MSESLSYPPPTGPRHSGAPPRGVKVPYDPTDVFAAPPGTYADVIGSVSPAPFVAPGQYDSPRLPPVAPVGIGTGPAYFAGVSPTDIATLDVPNAAEPVTLVGLDGGRPMVCVGNRRAKVKSFGGGIIVPLAGGGTTSLKMSSNIPGYPVIKHRGRELFRLPKPALADQTAILMTRFLPFVIGIIPGWFIGEYAARSAAEMVKRGESKWKLWALPLVLGFSMVAVVGLLILSSMFGAASDPGWTPSR